MGDIMFKGTKLRNLRLKKNMTQAQVAKELGMSRGTYSKYETSDREPPLKIMYNMCMFFDVDPSILFFPEGIRVDNDSNFIKLCRTLVLLQDNLEDFSWYSQKNIREMSDSEKQKLAEEIKMLHKLATRVKYHLIEKLDNDLNENFDNFVERFGIDYLYK